MKHLIILLSLYSSLGAQSYFPPIIGMQWDSIPESNLMWSSENVEALDQFLKESNTKCFIYLKNGKILKESYYNGHSQNEAWYWASAGKGITSFLVGMAQEQGLLDIEAKTSNYLGTWTSCTEENEDEITLLNQLTMTSGLNYSGDIFCTDIECLECINPPGEEWYYHNGPYTLLTNVIEAASDMSINQYANQNLLGGTGMTGLFTPIGYNRIFISKARSMARFGLLILNNGVWDGDTLLRDQVYLENMRSPSQDINPAYGYLWWLNGSETFRLPGSTQGFDGGLIPDAPDDLYMALGANGQSIFIIPSKNEVIIRMGENTGDDLVPVQYGRELWSKIADLPISTSKQEVSKSNKVLLYPNPSFDLIQITSTSKIKEVQVLNINGEILISSKQSSLDVSTLISGQYWIKVFSQGEWTIQPFIKL